MDDPAAWVRTVAWRLAVSQFRRRAVASRLLPRLHAGPGDAVDATLGSDVALDVVAALRALSPEHRRVLVLHEMVGLSVREVAAETGVPDGTVKSRLSRARERLGSALGTQYLEGAAPVDATVDAPVDAPVDARVREEEHR
jgi:RNA polymerase sigma-70 factor (ECF subfamily)